MAGFVQTVELKAPPRRVMRCASPFHARSRNPLWDRRDASSDRTCDLADGTNATTCHTHVSRRRTDVTKHDTCEDQSHTDAIGGRISVLARHISAIGHGIGAIARAIVSA